VAFCEIEPFPRKVLAKHWPKVPIYDDVRTLTAERLAADGIAAIDVITGGFPCQDLSAAGQKSGLRGDRSGLFFEIVRLAGELRPQFIIMENSPELLFWMGDVLRALAGVGFDASWEVIPAGIIGAPHLRERVWIVAHAHGHGRDFMHEGEDWCIGTALRSVESLIEQRGTESFKPDCGAGQTKGIGITQCSGKDVADASGERLARAAPPGFRVVPDQAGTSSGCESGGNSAPWRAWAPEPDVGRVANGVPARVDRLRALGNAVVPQIPEIIGRAILEAERMT